MKHKQIRSCIHLISNGTLTPVFINRTTFKVVCKNPYLNIDTLDVLGLAACDLIKEKTGYSVVYSGLGEYKLKLISPPAPSTDNTPF